jgi:class 3 adenylate cyclase/tetratricopeptide (TPR) repeat protein
MEQRKEIEQAISRLEAEREHLGDATVDAALSGLHRQLAELDESEAGTETDRERVEHTGERRVVTILFCDVASSTALAESMDPEAWADIMKEAFEYLIEPVEHYGGTVARLMGDAILAFFGAPTAHEDDPQRAVLAGLAIVEDIRPYREKLQEEKGLDFNVRVGVNTGLAVVGDVGSETAGEYTAMGDAVNLAARMEQTAAPGTVQIAQDTYALVAPLFDFKELGGITVKGKREPVLAYQVLGRKSEPGSLRGLAGQGISSPLVGRERELASARKGIDKLLAGQGGILFIHGEAGVGKSRLLAELHNHPAIENSQLTWLEGHTLSYGQTISYWPFLEILWGYAEINEEDNETQAWLKLERAILELFPEESAEILPYLASLLAIEPRGKYVERVKYLDGEALGHQVYRASRLFFQRLAEQKPLVLVIEDLHWMDNSSVGLLEHLLPLVRRVPLLFCILSRPEPDTPFSKMHEISAGDYASWFTEISLTPLSDGDSNRLVRNLLEIDALPSHLRQMMVSKADGNPYFLEEIVRELIDAGAIVLDTSNGRWRATPEARSVTVPDTVQGLINARIDRLDANLRRIVRRAAVIGRRFLFRILNAILDEDINLEGQLDQLRRIELIREVQPLPELEYIFKHALAQEAAYEGILVQERRELHARVGDAIERLMADRLDEFYGLLAYHFSSAEKWEQAQEYLFKAGDQAGKMAADAEALALYQQAMEAYAQVRGDDREPIEHARLERKIGEAFSRLGEFSQARIYLNRAMALLGETLPESKWAIRLALLGALLTQLGHRLFSSRFVGSMSGTTDPAAVEIFLAAQTLTWIELGADRERYLLAAIKSLNASERGGYPDGSANIASALSIAFDSLGLDSLSERYYHLADDYSRHIKHSQLISRLPFDRSYHFNIHGEFNKSLEYAQHAVELAKSTGDLIDWGSAKFLVTWAHYLMCRLDKAVETSQEMIIVAEESSTQNIICWGLFALGATQRRLGQLDEAISSLLRAIEIAEILPDFSTILGAGGALIHCYVAKGELDQALSVIDVNQGILKTNAVVPNAPYFGNGRSEAYLSVAESSTGKVRQDWLKKANLSCRETLKVARVTRPTLPDALGLQGRYEWLRGNSATAQKLWEKALNEAQRMGERYQRGTIHLEMGRRLGDREHLQQAQAILEGIGAEFDLSKAREELAKLGET